MSYPRSVSRTRPGTPSLPGEVPKDRPRRRPGRPVRQTPRRPAQPQQRPAPSVPKPDLPAQKGPARLTPKDIRTNYGRDIGQDLRRFGRYTGIGAGFGLGWEAGKWLANQDFNWGKQIQPPLPAPPGGAVYNPPGSGWVKHATFHQWNVTTVLTQFRDWNSPLNYPGWYASAEVAPSPWPGEPYDLTHRESRVDANPNFSGSNRIMGWASPYRGGSSLWNEAWTYRELYRRVDPNAAPVLRIIREGEPMPGTGKVTLRPFPVYNTTVQVSEANAPYGESTPAFQPRAKPAALPRPPGRNTKERKARLGRQMGAIFGLLGTVTDKIDTVNVIYEALPKNFKRQQYWKLGRQPNPLERAELLYQNVNKIYLVKALNGYVKMQLEDMVYAAGGKQIANANIDQNRPIGWEAGGSLTGGGEMVETTTDLKPDWWPDFLPWSA